MYSQAGPKEIGVAQSWSRGTGVGGNELSGQADQVMLWSRAQGPASLTYDAPGAPHARRAPGEPGEETASF